MTHCTEADLAARRKKVEEGLQVFRDLDRLNLEAAVRERDEEVVRLKDAITQAIGLMEGGKDIRPQPKKALQILKDAKSGGSDG